jgi:hypothetical protein
MWRLYDGLNIGMSGVVGGRELQRSREGEWGSGDGMVGADWNVRTLDVNFYR